MSKNKRKRRLKEEDFKKKKLKVGKKLPMPDNVTRTNFKARNINIVEQNFKQHGGEQETNFKGQKLKDLLNSCCHYNAQGREGALLGLKDLFERHPKVLKDNLNEIFQRVLVLITDLENSVRKAFLAIILLMFKDLSETEISPFFANIVAYLCSAMTHINENIRLDSLKFLDLCLKYFPQQVSVNPKGIIQNFISVISNEKSGVFKSAGVFVKTKLKAKMTSQKTQLEVLARLNRLLSVVFADVCIKSIDGQNANEMSESLHLTGINHIGSRNSSGPDSSCGSTNPMRTIDPSYSTNPSSIFNPNPILVSNFTLKAASEFQASRIDQTWLMEFISSLAPVLFEYWVQCCPAEFCMNLIPIKGETVSLKIIKEILEIFVTLAGSLKKNVSDQGVFCEYMNSKLFPLFNTHFMKVFPFNFTLQESWKKFKKNGIIESITDSKLNSLIAQLFSYYIPELKTDCHILPRWASETLTYLQKVLLVKEPNQQRLLTVASEVESVIKLVEMFLLHFPEGFEDEKMQLLESIYELFDSAHPSSNKKKILLAFLGELINGTNKQNQSMRAILDEWLKSSLRMINLKEVSGDMKYAVLTVCKSGILQGFPALVNAMSRILPSIFEVHNFSSLQEDVQQLAIELLYLLSRVPSPALFKVLAKLCISNSLTLQVFKYLMFVVHHLVHSHPSSSVLSTVSHYLSFMLSLTIGHTENQLDQFQSLEKEHSSCYHYKEINNQNTIVAELESNDRDHQITEKSWRHANEVIEIICSHMALSDYGTRFLEMLNDPLCKLFNTYPILPLEAVYRLLYLVKTLLHLAKERGVTDFGHYNNLLGLTAAWCSVLWHFTVTVASEFGNVNFVHTVINNIREVHIALCRSSEIVLKGILVSFIPCTLPGREPQLTCKVLINMLKEFQGQLAAIHQKTLEELHQNLASATKDGLLDSQVFSDFQYQYQCWTNLFGI